MDIVVLSLAKIGFRKGKGSLLILLFYISLGFIFGACMISLMVSVAQI